MKTLLDILKYRAEDTPDKIAYRFLDNNIKTRATVTYSELHQKTKYLASQLLEVAEPGDCIVLALTPGVDYVVSFYACLYAGLIAIPLYSPRGTQHIRRILKIAANANPKLILSTESVVSRLQSTKGLDVLLREVKLYCLEDLENPKDKNKAYSPHPDIAYLQYTSGSTGTPKGVIVSHSMIMANCAAITTFFRLNEKSFGVFWLPPYHDMGLVGGILIPLYVGYETAIMSPSVFIRDPMNWLKAISTYRATVSGAPNFAYEQCLETLTQESYPDLDLSSWDLAFAGAEQNREKTLTAFIKTFATYGLRNTTIYPCYGLAEATLLVTGAKGKARLMKTLTVDKDILNKEGLYKPTRDKNKSKQLVSCGQVIDNHSLFIINPNDSSVCKEGQVGEVCIHGDSVFSNYYKSPEYNLDKIFIEINSKSYLRTGDLGFLLAGELYITGRTKEMVIIRGKNHYNHDIEETILNSSNTIETNGCAVVYQEEMDRIIALCSIRKPCLKNFHKKAVVKKICKNVAVEHEIELTDIYFLKQNALPKTSSGKLQRNLVLNLLEKGKLQILYHWCRDDDRLTNQLINWLRNYTTLRINSQLIDERRSIPPYILLDFASKGLFGMLAYKRYSGLSLSFTEMATIMQQIAAIDISLAVMVGYQNILVVNPIQKHANNHIKDLLLCELTTGRQIGAFCVTEPEVGSNIPAITVTATKCANGWLLNGTKRWNSAGWANIMLVGAKTVDQDNHSLGISVFVVTRDMPGVSSGEEALTMGWRGISQASLILNNVFVKENWVIGGIGQGLTIIDDTLAISRVGIAELSIGITKRALQLMHRYASRRQVLTGLLSNSPIVTHMISQIIAELDGYEILVKTIFKQLDKGHTPPAEISAALKVGATELCWKALDSLMQILGGRGYMENNIAARLFRDGRALRIIEGANEALSFYAGQQICASDNFNQFITDSLKATELSHQLTQLKERLSLVTADKQTTKGKSSNFRINGQYQLGRLSSYYLLLAALASKKGKKYQNSYRLIEKHLQSEIDFILKTQDQDSWFSHQQISNFIKRYQASIGDIQQQAPGEDLTIDPLLDINDSIAEDSTKKLQREVYSRDEVENWIITWIAKNRHINVSDISPQDSVFNFNIDSISGVRFVDNLNKHFKINAPTTLIWDYPKINKLTKVIIDEYMGSLPTTAAKLGKKAIDNSVLYHVALQLSEKDYFWLELASSAQQNRRANIFAYALLDQKIDPEKLASAWTTILNHFDVFKLFYSQELPEELQYTDQPHAEIQTLTIDTTTTSLDDYTNDYFKTHYVNDISSAPLAKLSYISSNQQNQSALLLCLSHFVFDALSTEKIFYWLWALACDEVSVDDLPKCGFLNYRFQQKEYYQTQKYFQDLNFWKEMHSNNKGINLPISKNDTPNPLSPNSHAIIETVETKLFSQIRKLCAHNNITLKGYLQSVLERWLVALTGESDINYSYAIAGNQQADEAKIIGFMADSIYLSTSINQDDTCAKLAKSIDIRSIKLSKHARVSSIDLMSYFKHLNIPESKVFFNYLAPAMYDEDESERPYKLMVPEEYYHQQVGDNIILSVTIIEYSDTLTLNFKWRKEFFTIDVATSAAKKWNKIITDDITEHS